MNVKLTRHLGRLKVDINGKLYEPLSFKSFRPNPNNVSEFYSAGVRLFSVLTTGLTSALGVPYSLFGESWVGEGEYDFSAIDRQMDMFLKNAPDAYFAPMIQIDTRDWYLEAHPDKPNRKKQNNMNYYRSYEVDCVKSIRTCFLANIHLLLHSYERHLTNFALMKNLYYIHTLTILEPLIAAD